MRRYEEGLSVKQTLGIKAVNHTGTYLQIKVFTYT